MKVLGIYGSPRKNGNSDLLLNRALEGARDAGAETAAVYCRSLSMSGCIECGGCDETGVCVVKDDMTEVYPLLEEAEIIFLASPIFFYSVTAQAKALIDRSQAMWNRRRLKEASGKERSLEKGTGYLIAVGATKGKNLFQSVELVARYFFDALDMEYGEGLLVRAGEHKGAVAEDPDLMDRALELGRKSVERKLKEKAGNQTGS